ncbi:MATE family efflux transporter [Candidatus Woesearchaeota archaeon]|nr:MATE family efflux transporter [Candidatus Woesearchaeota archaeon]
MSTLIDTRIARFKKSPEKSLLLLSLPVIVGMLLHIVYNITDTAFVGRIGVDALAALTFSFPIFFVAIALSGLIGTGATALIAQRLGARQKKEASRIATQALVLSIALSVLFTVVAFFFLGSLLTLMGATPSVAALSFGYLLPILLASPFLFLSAGFAAVLNGEGNTTMPAIVRGVSVFLNLGMDYLFIFVFGWGIFGAGLATALAIVFEVIAFAYYIFIRKGNQITLFRKWQYDTSVTKDILKIGVPTSAAHFLMAFSWFFFNGLFARFGTETVAAYGLVGRTDSIAFMPLFGLTIGLVTLVGMFYGAKEYKLIVRVIKAAVWYGLLYAVPLGLLFWVFPTLVLRVLTNDATVISIAASLLQVSVFTYPLMAVGFMLGRAMVGLGDGIPALVITSIRLLLVAVPLGWLFMSLGYGPSSLILAMVAAGVVAAILAVLWVRAKLQKIKLECTST